MCEVEKTTYLLHDSEEVISPLRISKVLKQIQLVLHVLHIGHTSKSSGDLWKMCCPSLALTTPGNQNLWLLVQSRKFGVLKASQGFLKCSCNWKHRFLLKVSRGGHQSVTGQTWPWSSTLTLKYKREDYLESGVPTLGLLIGVMPHSPTLCVEDKLKPLQTK